MQYGFIEFFGEQALAQHNGAPHHNGTPHRNGAQEWTNPLPFCVK
jgi:hypothetical protein